MDTQPIKDLLLEVQEGAGVGRLSDIAVQLTSFYATLSEEFKDIEVFRADRWLEIRKEVKSDTMAEKTWLATPEGKKWNELRIQLKYIEKTISSIKLRLRVAEGEAYGSY